MATPATFTALSGIFFSSFRLGLISSLLSVIFTLIEFDSHFGFPYGSITTHGVCQVIGETTHV